MALEDMTVAELRDLANRTHVQLGGLTLKADIIDALENAGVSVDETGAEEPEREPVAEEPEPEGEPEQPPQPEPEPEPEGPTGEVPELEELPSSEQFAVVYGEEPDPATGSSAVSVVEQADASREAAAKAQTEAWEEDPPKKVAATKVSNIQTPTGMVQRVEEIAKEDPQPQGYVTEEVKG